MASTFGAPDGAWVSLLMLAVGMVLLAAVIWKWWRVRSDGAGPARAAPARVPAHPPPALAEIESLVRQLIAELDARTDRLERLIAQADRLSRGADGARASGTRQGPRVISDDADPMAGRIYGLADEGLPVVEIARRLEQPTGKVELILALRGR